MLVQIGQTPWTDGVVVGVRVAASYKYIENDWKTNIRYNKYTYNTYYCIMYYATLIVWLVDHSADGDSEHRLLSLSRRKAPVLYRTVYFQ